MAQLAKRKRATAGFHLPQKPGRSNHFGTVTQRPGRKPIAAITADQGRQALGLPPRPTEDAVLDFILKTRERRSIFRKAVDKLTRRAA